MNDIPISTKKELCRLSIFSRLLFNKPEDSERILRRKITEISKIKDETEISDIFERMNLECISQTQYSLKYMVNAYIHASNVFLDAEFWDDRKAPSKKKLCLKLFIRSYAPDTPNIREVLRSIPGKNSDDDVMARIAGSADDGTEKVDVCFLLLLAWGIIPPFKQRTKKELDPIKSIEAMLKLLKCLNDCLNGKIGIIAELPIIRSCRMALEDCLENNEPQTIGELWSIPDTIGDDLKSYEAENIDVSVLHSDMLHLPGIWVDDKDNGESRFWIFPVNFRIAFQYKHTKNGWKLLPYEFAVCKPELDDPDTWYTFMVTPRGNELLLLGDKLPTEELIYSDYEVQTNDSDERVEKIIFSPFDGFNQEWHDWRCFMRLSENDPRFSEYQRVLENLYKEPSSLAQELKCDYRWLIDIRFALVAVDNDYLYISDLKAWPRYRMTKAKESSYEKKVNCDDDFVYMPSASSSSNVNLLNLEVSVSQPLYRIPREVTPVNKILNIDEKEKFEKFREVVKGTNIGDQITIYKLNRRDAVIKVLCFNKFSTMFHLDELEQKYGAKKITSKKELFGL